MAETMIGVFSTRELAENAISELEDKGYNVKDISIIMKDSEERDRLAKNTGANVGGNVAAGAATGAVLGGIAGILISIGAIAVPGIGGLLVAGPIATALGLTGVAATTAGGVVAGAFTGGIVGGLVSLGIPEERAKVYEERVKHGGILLAIPTLEGRIDEVQSILQKNGATDMQAVILPRVRDNRFDTDTSRDLNETNRTHLHYSQNDEYADATHVQKYLRHVDFPASKNDLLEVAEGEGANDDVLHALKDLPNKKFENSRQVEQAIGRHQ